MFPSFLLTCLSMMRKACLTISIEMVSVSFFISANISAPSEVTQKLRSCFSMKRIASFCSTSSFNFSFSSSFSTTSLLISILVASSAFSSFSNLGSMLVLSLVVVGLLLVLLLLRPLVLRVTSCN